MQKDDNDINGPTLEKVAQFPLFANVVLENYKKPDPVRIIK